MSRLTFAEGTNNRPSWSPDGSRIFFSSNRDAGSGNIFWKPADGTGVAEQVTKGDRWHSLTDVSYDGSTLLYFQENNESSVDIMTVEHGGDAQPEVFLQTPFVEVLGRFSPDGRWIAYLSNESGRPEIYVRPFKHGGGKWQVSTDGGSYPCWSSDGKELFYLNGKALMVVAVTMEESTFQAGNPTMLFEMESGVGDDRPYDVAPDGKRFVWIKNDAPQGEGEVDQSHLRFIFNWFEDVKAKVPTG